MYKLAQRKNYLNKPLEDVKPAPSSLEVCFVLFFLTAFPVSLLLS